MKKIDDNSHTDFLTTTAVAWHHISQYFIKRILFVDLTVRSTKRWPFVLNVCINNRENRRSHSHAIASYKRIIRDNHYKIKMDGLQEVPAAAHKVSQFIFRLYARMCRFLPSPPIFCKNEVVPSAFCVFRTYWNFTRVVLFGKK